MNKIFQTRSGLPPLLFCPIVLEPNKTSVSHNNMREKNYVPMHIILLKTKIKSHTYVAYVLNLLIAVTDSYLFPFLKNDFQEKMDQGGNPEFDLLKYIWRDIFDERRPDATQHRSRIFERDADVTRTSANVASFGTPPITHYNPLCFGTMEISRTTLAGRRQRDANANRYLQSFVATNNRCSGSSTIFLRLSTFPLRVGPPNVPTLAIPTTDVGDETSKYGLRRGETCTGNRARSHLLRVNPSIFHNDRSSHHVSALPALSIIHEISLVDARKRRD